MHIAVRGIRVRLLRICRRWCRCCRCCTPDDIPAVVGLSFRSSDRHADSNNNVSSVGNGSSTRVSDEDEISEAPTLTNHLENGSFRNTVMNATEPENGFVPVLPHCSLCSLCDRNHNQRLMADDILAQTGRDVPRRVCSRSIEHSSTGTYTVTHSSLSWDYVLPRADAVTQTEPLDSVVVVS